MNNELKKCLKCEAISGACKNLSEQELINLASACISTTVKKGDIVFREGNVAVYIAYIKTGLVKETMTGPGGKDQIFRILIKKSYIGMTSLLGNKVYHYTYTALTDLSVCYIEQETFINLMKINGEFSLYIMKSLCHDHLIASYKLVNQSQKKIYGKVADALLYFSGFIFEKKTFDLPLSRKEIANLIGTSRESVIRTLQAFQKEGIIVFKNNKFKILKHKQLQNISKNG
ncbi:MAG: Crp/Fnr family transcriptional regulator [Bacteroidales bacterium]|nr:Crp/Fnr family transcriptional regulator [Bacteroidales bacterium]